MTTPGTSPALRIAQVAPLWARVPPATYGGIELMVHLLTEELVRRGHDVTLFAAGDSRTSATLRAVGTDSVGDAMGRVEAYEYVHYANALLAEALRQADSFDVIHCHLGCSFIPFSVLSPVPVVHTPHTVLSVDDRWVVERYAGVPISAISHHQVAAIPRACGRDVRVVHHGIDFGAYEFGPGPGRYLVFLGRMSPQKSPLHAIEIAWAAGVPLVLAGQPQDHRERDYFAAEVSPLIDGKKVVYRGAVNHQQKNELLKNAGALLFPIQGEEAFGLAMIEAMACGTPVVAWEESSVPEVIDPGVTGFYGRSVEGLAGLVAPALALDRRRVRDHALRRFSHRRMVDDYVQMYTAITDQRRKAEDAHRTGSDSLLARPPGGEYQHRSARLGPHPRADADGP